MIIYIASYPRSGNSLTQQIIINYFERPITALNPRSKKAEFFASGKASFIKNWRYNAKRPSNRSKIQVLWNKLNERTFKIYNLNQWIALYDLNVPPYSKNCRYLMPGCKNILTPKNRQLLAADRNSHFFIKTHQLPYKEYFEGEYVIQPIRHPGAVLWSYYHLHKAENKDTTITLEKVIAGETITGSWSSYHQSWNRAISLLNNRAVRIRFEDSIVDRIKACEQISATIKLGYNPASQIPSFAKLRQKSPHHFRAGKATGWEEHYTDEQIQLLQKKHGSTMNQLGYKIDDSVLKNASLSSTSVLSKSS